MFSSYYPVLIIGNRPSNLIHEFPNNNIKFRRSNFFMKNSELLLQSNVVLKGKVAKSGKKSQEKINLEVNPKESAPSAEGQSTGSFVCTTCGAIFASENELVDHGILIHKPF